MKSVCRAPRGRPKDRGMSSSQLQELQAQIRSLNGRIDELAHKVDAIQQNQASAAQQQQPQPQPQMQPQAQPQQGQPPAMPPSGTVILGPSPAPQRPVEPSRVPPPGYGGVYPPPQSRARPESVPARSAEQVEFDRGVQLLQQRNFEAAKKVFERFVSKYPDSGLGESALYYVGECSSGERHYEDAIKAYQAVVDRYPKGGKTASALLKEGIGWQEIGEGTMARIIFTRLVTAYPGTAQARAAEKKLKKM